MFFKNDDSNDNYKISLEQFKNSIRHLENMGIKIDDPEKEFNNIDINHQGHIKFDDFCKFAIQKNIDDK